MSAGEQEPTSRRQYFAVLLVVVGIMGFVLAAWLYFGRQGPKTDGVNTTSFPSSTRPSRQIIDNYTVAPDLPKYIEIPAIRIPKTRILQLGITKNNQIATPGNIYDAGWYRGSAKPGLPGAMFIFGHVSSWSAKGVFYNLKGLRPGDKVIITRGDDKKFTYQVNSSKTYNYQRVDMAQVLKPVRTGVPGLNLMTCAGQVIKGTSEFNERLVVFTSLVKG